MVLKLTMMHTTRKSIPKLISVCDGLLIRPAFIVVVWNIAVFTRLCMVICVICKKYGVQNIDVFARFFLVFPLLVKMIQNSATNAI